MFVVYPSNIDYLIDEVRLKIGDITNTPRYTSSVIRTALLVGVRQLQRRWNNRYLVYDENSMLVDPQPVDVASGYLYVQIPQGYATISEISPNDVFRNPYHTFTGPGSLISQEDEYPILLSAALIMLESEISSSASVFQNWTDGEYSFSNVSSANAMRAMYTERKLELEKYFGKRLASPLRDSFAYLLP